jgi:hypothetical protein
MQDKDAINDLAKNIKMQLGEFNQFNYKIESYSGNNWQIMVEELELVHDEFNLNNYKRGNGYMLSLFIKDIPKLEKLLDYDPNKNNIIINLFYNLYVHRTRIKINATKPIIDVIKPNIKNINDLNFKDIQKLLEKYKQDKDQKRTIGLGILMKNNIIDLIGYGMNKSYNHKNMIAKKLNLPAKNHLNIILNSDKLTDKDKYICLLAQCYRNSSDIGESIRNTTTEKEENCYSNEKYLNNLLFFGNIKMIFSR